MKWIQAFQLFLFDFDGLLVDTEYLHYQSYIDMMASLGYVLDWDFARYCEVAHINETALREELYSKFPHLDPNWKRIYQKKNQIFLELLSRAEVKLMPGVARLLQALEKAQIRRCVVTNSGRELTQIIRARLPILNTIPYWVTREEYHNPKPDPECYLRAIELYGKEGDKIIGFEDSIRGLQALQQTPAFPVLICSSSHPLVNASALDGVVHFNSFEKINSLPS